MGWVENKLDYAGGRLEQAVEHAAAKLNEVVRDGISQAGGELRDVVLDTSREVDAKLEKISEELHSQRHFTKADVQELVDYAAAQFGATLDARIERIRSEADAFIAHRQQEMVRERKRFVVFALIAAGIASVLTALVLAYLLK